jgi:hypothetical protein
MSLRITSSPGKRASQEAPHRPPARPGWGQGLLAPGGMAEVHRARDTHLGGRLTMAVSAAVQRLLGVLVG